MGVDTKMTFVFKKYSGEDNDMQRTATLYSVQKVIMNHLKKEYTNYEGRDYSSFNGRAVRFNFNDGEDTRSIFACMDCADTLDKFSVLPLEETIHFMLGAYGNSVEILEKLAQALLSEIGGRAYLDESDCDDKDYVQLKMA